MNNLLTILCFVFMMDMNSLQEKLMGNPRAKLQTDFPKDTVNAIYYHDQTVAVLNLGPNNEINDCNLIEVYNTGEAYEVLKNLSHLAQPRHITFRDMTKLIQQCELMDRIIESEHSMALSSNKLNKGNRVGISSLTLLSGILPGTKWCGAGDIAESYHDLGQDADIDRCCRSHDLCPIKVRAQQTRYNLTNYAFYTKSHCTCDEALYNCLKAAKHPIANIMGHVYFNIVKVPCIEDTPQGQISSKRFVSVKMSF